MAKKNVPEAEDGLRDVAVAVGSALGKLAHKMGLGGPAVSPVTKPQRKHAVVRKPLAPGKKLAPKKRIATKKVASKRASSKTVKTSRTGRGW